MNIHRSILISLVALLVTAGATLASSSAGTSRSATAIVACANDVNGNLRLADAGGHCRQNEHLVTWSNGEGAAGPTGPAGPAGPAAPSPSPHVPGCSFCPQCPPAPASRASPFPSLPPAPVAVCARLAPAAAAASVPPAVTGSAT